MEVSISRDPGRISPWEALDHLRQKQQTCASDIDEIKRSCAEKCGKKHVTECQECYIKVLKRLRDRYSPDEAHIEWFDTLPEFWRKDKGQLGLPVSFPEPLDEKTDLEAVEAHLETLRRAWYRRELSTSGIPGMLELAAGNNPALAALFDGDSARDVAAEEMEHPPPKGRSRLSDVLGQAAGGEAPDLEEFMALYRAARTRGASAVADLYVDAFFRDPRTGTVPPASQPYIDRLRAAAEAPALAGTGLGLGDEHVGQALEALQHQMCREAGARDGNARKAHQVRQRLDELRRGQAAHHQSKARKAAARQQQQQSKGGAGLRVPPCATCGRGLGDGKGSFPCALCLVFAVAELGDEGEMQVYCSVECQDKGQDEHAETSHRCCAKRCLLDSNDASGLEPERFVAQVCRECLLDHGRWITYCSDACAERDFHIHRETVHLPDRRAAGLMGSEVEVDREHIVTMNRGGGHFEKVPDVVGRFFWSADEAVAAVLDGRLAGGMDWNVAGAS